MDHEGHFLDVEIGSHDVQALTGPDAVAALFARLGYNPNTRTVQATGNLEIAADGTVRPLKRLSFSPIRMVFFKSTSSNSRASQFLTRALGRAFRNRAVNYLLVLSLGPFSETRQRLSIFAQNAMEGGYEAVKADLNAAVYRLYGL